MPRVSAIIIVLNGEDYIGEAIESVLAQDFGDWELLIVDDGSFDRTREIVQGFVDADPERIRLLRHPDRGNHGMSATRNLGIENARGDYIAFLDADDAWLPGKLGDQVEILDRYPEAAMAYGRTLMWRTWVGKGAAADYFDDLGVTPDALHKPPRLFLQLLENRCQTPTTCNAIMRREAIDSVGGFDPAFRGMFEDQVFFAKLMSVFPVYVSGACWAKYRQHTQSACAIEPSVTARHLTYLRAIRRYLVEQGKRISLERKAVEKAMWSIRMGSLEGRARHFARKLLR